MGHGGHRPRPPSAGTRRRASCRRLEASDHPTARDGALGALVVLGAVTVVALEGGEVVVLRTHDTGGESRETRTWVADDGDSTLLEAANGERPFLRQLRADPAVELRRGGGWHRCQAVVLDNPQGHRRIRDLLAARYGWRDRWIGHLADTSGSLAVRLACD